MVQTMDFGAVLPGVGVFGGVRRFLEIGNELVRRGHRFTLYHPAGTPPDWLKFEGDVAALRELSHRRHEILITNDTAHLSEFQQAKADAKFFYFVLENIKNERSIARSSDWSLLANSTGMASRLRRRYGVQVDEVIGGINVDVFRPGDLPRGDGYRIIAFGRASRRKKGVPLVLRAAEAFSRKHPDATLVLFDHVGPGNERDPRERIRVSAPHEFHLNPSQDELAALYAGCDVFLGAERRAGWANTVAEAMACGVPVVCTRSGALDLALHDETAWVVPFRHPWWLHRGLRTLHDSPELAGRLRENALQRVRRFAWPKVVDQLERVVRHKLALIP